MPGRKMSAVSKAPSKPDDDAAGAGAHKMPSVAEAANRFHLSHRFQEPGSRADLNFQFTGRLNLFARRYRTRLNEALREIGQTQARWDALFWISVSEEGATQSELAERIGVEGPTLVRMLNRLEQEGLVERRGAKGDRRAKTIRMKPAAEKALSQIAELSRPFRNDLLQDLSDEEVALCLKVLDRILSRLDRDSNGR